MRRAMAVVLMAVAIAAAWEAAAPGRAHAHPLGNFTVNQYSEIAVASGRVSIALVVDRAEIPTYQARLRIDRNGDGTIGPSESDAYRSAECDEMAAGVTVRFDGRPLAVRTAETRLEFPPGSGGLPTLRLQCSLHAAITSGSGEHRLEYRNQNLTDRVGWREVVARGEGTVLTSSNVPSSSVSARLTRYPDDLLQSPPDVRGATLRFRPGVSGSSSDAERSAVGSFLPGPLERASQAFMSFVSRATLTPLAGLIGVLLAIVLGGVHAFAPGHGKTVIAAYLVGQRRSYRDGVLLGLTVTATHTVGVLLLGAALSLTAVSTPERVFPVLGLLSGVLIAILGIGMLRQALARRRDGEGHHHAHPDHGEGVGGRPPGRRQMMLMGLAGGLTPSPSALLVLLGAVALGRPWFGVLLVAAFGLGMAFTLTAGGFALVKMREFLDRRAHARHSRLATVARLLPIGTASLVAIAGVALAVRGATGVL